jgi:hypothetical protein
MVRRETVGPKRGLLPSRGRGSVPPQDTLRRSHQKQAKIAAYVSAEEFEALLSALSPVN